ncbi:MAG: pyruvate kinase [Bacteroidales bacterium]|nr:pyruvate kinase [Bacteroidales bacterium]MBN2761945.1 pyruvate kinase [Bacteroidales bacterium]
MLKKTKIVATISDLRCDVEFIKSLYENGMNVVRLNTAHQSFEDTLKIINNVRKVSDRIALMLDTKGPEIRTTSSDYKVALNKGDRIKMKGDASKNTTPDCIYVNYNNFVDEVSLQTSVLIDDGEIELKVVEKKEDFLIMEAVNEGLIKGKKSINVPNASFHLPALSSKDRDYINFAVEHDLDFIAHSFVRSKEDVLEIQTILDSQNSKVKIIAKIENQEGVDHIDEILQYVYGVMVARGDLAIEIPCEKIPGIQKMIINKCIDARKPVIIATQMLHSMIENPRPTRAEVSDVANAIYSKTDAIMLSGETAFGQYPVEAVQTMAKIAVEVEKSRGDIHKTPLFIASSRTSAYLSKSAVEASLGLDCKAIIADTTTGRTIRNAAGFRGRKVIFAECYDSRVMRELALSFGVYTYFVEDGISHKFIPQALITLLKDGLLQKEDKVVIMGGNFQWDQGATFIEINTVENLMRLGRC